MDKGLVDLGGHRRGRLECGLLFCQIGQGSEGIPGRELNCTWRVKVEAYDSPGTAQRCSSHGAFGSRSGFRSKKMMEKTRRPKKRACYVQKELDR